MAGFKQKLITIRNCYMGFKDTAKINATCV